MKCKVTALIATVLIVIIVLTLFFTLNLNGNKPLKREFYVGIEYAYSDNVADLKTLVDKVKDYTNLLVIGDIGITFNETALTEACDYIYNAKLNFIVLFTGLEKYNYSITQWMLDAQPRYGERFLGIDRFDEPGGNQMDDGPSQLVNSTMINSTTTYTEVAQNFTDTLSIFPSYYKQFSPKVFTSDYGLYWFDYKAGYDAIFAEFPGNDSRQRHIALCRGAADAFGRDWGVVVTWKYNQSPYIESADELYNDLSLAYSAGAKYTVVFSYAPVNVTNFGILTEEHFAALQKFWNTLQSDPGSFGSNSATVAYVMPAAYGFNFRLAGSSIWGLFPADSLSEKIFNDVVFFIDSYGAKIDILYNETERIEPLFGNYSSVYYWNQL